MKYLFAFVVALSLLSNTAFADDYEDERLERLFERLEHAPPGEKHKVRKQIRKYLKQQKRLKRKENLSKLREKREMRYREEREYRREYYHRERGYR